MLDLPDSLRKKLIQVLSEETSVQQAILFGSRARGDAKVNSDVDLALIGSQIPLSIHTKLREAAGLYTLDIVRIDELDNQSLLESIERDGSIIYHVDRCKSNRNV